MRSDDPDLDLVVRAGRGDPAAVQALVARKLPRVLTLATRVLSDPAEAEDVAQETFLRVWRQAPRWKPGGAKFDTWMHTVALNLCRDRLRRRRETPTDEPPDLVDPGSGAEAGLMGQQRAARVEAAVQTLPERQREALVLSTWQEMGNPQIGEIMGLSVEAVESLLARARRSLRHSLSDLKEA